MIEWLIRGLASLPVVFMGVVLVTCWVLEGVPTTGPSWASCVLLHFIAVVCVGFLAWAWRETAS